MAARPAPQLLNACVLSQHHCVHVQVRCTRCIPCLRAENGSVAHGNCTRCDKCTVCKAYAGCPFIAAVTGVDGHPQSSTRNSYCVKNESPRLVKGTPVGLLDKSLLGLDINGFNPQNYKGTKPYWLVFGTRVDTPGYQDLTTNVQDNSTSESPQSAIDTHAQKPFTQCSRPSTSSWGGMVDRIPFTSADARFSSPASGTYVRLPFLSLR